MTSMSRLRVHRPRNPCLLLPSLSLSSSALRVLMNSRGWSVFFLASNVTLVPHQPGFSRDFPIYYLLISYIYLINRYLQVNFLVPSISKRHRFDPYLKNLHLIHNYLHHTDQFPISACFQSFWSALFSAVSSPIWTAMHYSPRLS